jgi:hypothetical protein
MAANHTLGPWICECIPGRSDGFVFSESQPEGYNICTINPDIRVEHEDRRKSDDWVFSDRRSADARLIAAAPDMFDMLKRVRAAIGRQDGFSSLNGFEDLIDRIIKKIEGVQS